MDKPFALALDDATLDESGRMLTTEKGSFKRQNTSEIWNEKKFYVRKCYQPIADLMFEKNPPAMSLLGSSGIGKSNFVIYLIWRRFQDPELSKFPVFLHRENQITQFKKEDSSHKARGVARKLRAQATINFELEFLAVLCAFVTWAYQIFCAQLISFVGNNGVRDSLIFCDTSNTVGMGVLKKISSSNRALKP